MDKSYMRDFIALPRQTSEIPVKKILINGNDIADFVIVSPLAASESIRFSAEQMQYYIAQIAGVTLPIVTDDNIEVPKEILVGMTNRKNYGYPKPYDISHFEHEGFSVFLNGTKLVTIGNGRRGTLYAVYELFEKYLGVRFFTEDCQIVYRRDKIELTDFYDEQLPYFEWRDPFVPCYYGADISAKRKINSYYMRNFDSKYGGNFMITGRFVHTMEQFLGVPQTEQPCFSDEKNLAVTIDLVRKILRQHPEARRISVSQNDVPKPCTCPRCAAIDEEEESHAGSMLRFVNGVADAIAEEFPKVSIIALAYQHTIKPPKITKPRDNVIIQFCPMESCYAHNIDAPDCPLNVRFVDHLNGWKKICKRIYLWDYIANFPFTLPPFPNFNVLHHNIKFYVANNIIGVFSEGDNHSSAQGYPEFSTLRAYLTSIMLWNPKMEYSETYIHSEEFLAAYYGGGSESILEFMKLMADSTAGHFGCETNPLFLVDIMRFRGRIDEMNELWNRAEAGADNEVQLDRVKRARLQFTYMKLLHRFNETMKDGSEEEKAKIIAENEDFYNLLVKYNMTQGPHKPLPEVTDFSRSIIDYLFDPPKEKVAVCSDNG